MRNAVLLALTVALSVLVVGHARGQPEEAVPPDPERVLPRPGDMPLPEIEPQAPQGARSCEAIEADARALLDQARQCTTDERCELLSFAQMLGPESCITSFQCTAAVSADLDRAAFLEAAAPLVLEKRACGECAIAGCLPPTDLVAACVQGRCELLAR